jgi:DNA replicative helicase MCM subunit Mcm2 (Cdc46/Mcm family)
MVYNLEMKRFATVFVLLRNSLIQVCSSLNLRHKSLLTAAVDPAAARSYRSDIILMLQKFQRRLVVSIDEVRAHNSELAEGLLQQPFDFALAFDRALHEVVQSLPNTTTKQTSEDTMYYCAFSGSFGQYACNPRTLS